MLKGIFGDKKVNPSTILLKNNLGIDGNNLSVLGLISNLKGASMKKLDDPHDDCTYWIGKI